MQDRRQWGRESLTPPALRSALLRCAGLRSPLPVWLSYLTIWSRILFFNFFHFLIFDSRFFFWGRLGARFLLFGLGGWGRSFVSEICEIVDFHIFILSARHSCRQKIFCHFWDSQTYMRVSPSHHFLSQLFLHFLQPNYLSTFLEKPTFSTKLYPKLYDWLSIIVLSSWPSSSLICIFWINSKTFRFCPVGNFYFRRLI